MSFENLKRSSVYNMEIDLYMNENFHSKGFKTITTDRRGKWYRNFELATGSLKNFDRIEIQINSAWWINFSYHYTLDVQKELAN